HERAGTFVFVKVVECVCQEEGVAGCFGAVEYAADVAIACGIRIFEEADGGFMDEGGDGIAQVVESFPQRGTPFLIPAGAAAGTAAVGAPAFDAVGAAPGG